ncbi:MAG: signal peptidase I, partial [Nitrospinae bacterium]|nr:signal peptidase I [Nitrospinota bacterium]
MTNNTLENAEGNIVKRKSVAREYAEAIFIALLLALFIRTFVVQAFKIPSGSMEETLLIGDHILVSKFSYGTHIPNEIPFLNIKLFDDIILFPELPERGDIIVFKYPKDESRDFIKRVIGVPGDLLQVKHQKVFINGEPALESFARHTVSPSASPLVPLDDCCSVLGPDCHLS